jgi:hypothetical protein
MAKMEEIPLLLHKQIIKKAKINYVEKLLKDIFIEYKMLKYNILCYPTYPQRFIISP